MPVVSEKFKRGFVLAMQNMDLSLIDMLLDEDFNYQEAPKTVFLEKMKGIFESFRQSGATKLIPHKGFCAEIHCENIGCSGYCFVGDNHQQAIQFVFNERYELDKNVICDCYNLRTEFEDVKFEKQIDVEIFNEEKIGFSPSDDYFIIKDSCELAMKKLSEWGEQIIPGEFISKWLLNFEELNSKISFEDKYLAYKRFKDFYCEMNFIWSLLELKENGEEAVNTYSLLNKYNTNEIKEWILKNKAYFIYYDATRLSDVEYHSSGTPFISYQGYKIGFDSFEWFLKLEAIFGELFSIGDYNDFLFDDDLEDMQGDTEGDCILIY